MAASVELVRYDEPRLVAALRELGRVEQAAFGAACSTRLSSACDEFAQERPAWSAGAAHELLDAVWQALNAATEHPTDEASLAALQTACRAAVPGKADGRWSMAKQNAEDMTAAMTYAVRALQTGDGQNAGWSAKRAYECVFLISQKRLDIKIAYPKVVPQIEACDLVQRELRRQALDLETLRGGATTETLRLLRARALNDARDAIRELQ